MAVRLHRAPYGCRGELEPSATSTPGTGARRVVRDADGADMSTIKDIEQRLRAARPAADIPACPLAVQRWSSKSKRTSDEPQPRRWSRRGGLALADCGRRAGPCGRERRCSDPAQLRRNRSAGIRAPCDARGRTRRAHSRLAGSPPDARGDYQKEAGREGNARDPHHERSVVSAGGPRRRRPAGGARQRVRLPRRQTPPPVPPRRRDRDRRMPCRGRERQGLPARAAGDRALGKGGARSQAGTAARPIRFIAICPDRRTGVCAARRPNCARWRSAC